MHKQKTGIPRLLEFAGKYKALVVTACVLSGISSVFMLLPFVCIWLCVREVLRAAPDMSALDGGSLAMYGWWAVAAFAVGFVLYFAALMCSHLAAFHTARNMKSQALRHLVTLPLGFFSLNSSGKLRKIIDENSGQTETFLAHQIPDLSGTVVTAVTMLVLLFVFDWRLGLICLIPMAAGFVIQMKMMTGESMNFMKVYQDSLEEMNNEAVEYVRGVPVVKVFQQTVYSFKSFYSSIMKYKKYVSAYALSFKKAMSAFTTILNGTFFLLIPAGFLFAVYAPDIRLFLQNYIFYLLFTPACSAMINKIMYMASYKMIAEESVRRIDSLLQEKPLPKPDMPKMPSGLQIEFSHVSFTYSGSEIPALNDVSFTVPAGSTVALVGPSGGGKTTAASLLPRFWDVNAGSVKIGGADVRDIEPDVLMKQIAFVFQDSRLFKDTVFNNIRAAKPNAAAAEVERAARAAQCGDILEKLPQGLQTVIGTRGIYLSGGEQQRIALARAILKDAPIIVLDEATAFADPENEHKIQVAFEKLTKGKTVLMIAHRLSTVKNADEILVLSNGAIEEKGRHEELLENDGMYASLWRDYQSSVSWSVGKEVSYVS
ncbi:ABC transporter ATP-binding protein [Caproiciproducens sp. R1]|uniref:ABC transporter ATP-binding protein n=1 Tax=Caproiciproducens sp. R1 TaxID=3435000 RepID=UPI0040346760